MSRPCFAAYRATPFPTAPRRARLPFLLGLCRLSAEFDYVVRDQEQARVAFGSAQSRAFMPLAGLRGSASRLANLAMRTTDNLHHLGPAAYSTANQGALCDVLNKVRGSEIRNGE